MNKYFNNILSSLTFKLTYFTLLLAMMLMLVQCSNDKGEKKSILIIGDSNAASEVGWVVQLEKIDSTLNIINKSHGGNTIGFDNNSDPKKNELKNIDKDISDAIILNSGKTFDSILLALGTNDCKAAFADSQSVVPKNFSKLIHKIQNYDYGTTENPKLVILSPPPIGPDSLLLDKFKGGSQRVRKLIPKFEKIALENSIHFINVHEPLEKVYVNYAKDGVHMNAEGQMFIARKVKDYLDSI